MQSGKFAYRFRCKVRFIISTSCALLTSIFYQSLKSQLQRQQNFFKEIIIRRITIETCWNKWSKSFSRCLEVSEYKNKVLIFLFNNEFFYSYFNKVYTSIWETISSFQRFTIVEKCAIQKRVYFCTLFLQHTT